MTKQNQGSFKTKQIPFTQVCNIIAQNDDLSHGAKGLYLLIQSHITNPYLKVTKNFLMKHSKEGRRAFDSSWNELKRTGFLKQDIKRNENNQFIYEYDLLDEPVIEETTDTKKQTSPYVQNDTTETIDSPYTRFATTENVLTQNDTINNKTNINNTDFDNTLTNETENFTFSDNSIISYHTEENEMKREIKETPVTKKKQEENNNTIAENISLDVLLVKYPDKAEQINEIYNLMCDTVNSSKTIFRISGENKPIYGIRRAFFSLNEEHIEYIIDCLEKNTTRIKNYKAYLLTTIYNSYFTCSNAIDLSFNHDFKDRLYVKQ